jgi:ribosomal protein L37AE/L43A
VPSSATQLRSCLPDMLATEKINWPEVTLTCPKCGETRLIEQVDGRRWFCAVCAHSWAIGGVAPRAQEYPSWSGLTRR